MPLRHPLCILSLGISQILVDEVSGVVTLLHSITLVIAADVPTGFGRVDRNNTPSAKWQCCRAGTALGNLFVLKVKVLLEVIHLLLDFFDHCTLSTHLSILQVGVIKELVFADFAGWLHKFHLHCFVLRF